MFVFVVNALAGTGIHGEQPCSFEAPGPAECAAPGRILGGAGQAIMTLFIGSARESMNI